MGEVQGWYLIIALVCFAGVGFNFLLPYSDFNLVRLWVLATIGGVMLVWSLPNKTD